MELDASLLPRSHVFSAKLCVPCASALRFGFPKTKKDGPQAVLRDVQLNQWPPPAFMPTTPSDWLNFGHEKLYNAIRMKHPSGIQNAADML